jgi:hypothetical protein
MLEHLENMIPWDAKKLGKKTKEGPDAPKEDPRELPWPETHPARLRKGLQEGARGPRGVPEARQSQNHWKTNRFLMIFIENMQKALFLQANLLMRRPRTPPQRGAKIGIRILKVAPRTSESLIFHKLAALKSGCLKWWKNEKTFLKKVSLTTVTHFRPPQARLLEKKCLEHCK